MTEKDNKIVLLTSELRSNLESRIEQLDDSDYGDQGKGAKTVAVVEDEIFKFIGKVLVGAISNLFKKAS